MITKCDKFGLQIAMGLHSATDYKVIQYIYLSRFVLTFTIIHNLNLICKT